MIPKHRESYNQHFNEKQYSDYLEFIKQSCQTEPDFRIAETPVFYTKDFKEKMIATCEEIVDFINHKDFASITQRSIPQDHVFIRDEGKPQMMVFDFGVCEDEQGNIVPRLIEMQGFPTLYGFQLLMDDAYRQLGLVPEGFDSFFNGYNKESYLQLLKEIIIGDEKPEEVILLELYPETQKTKIDFKCIEILLGIKTICVTKLVEEGDKLCYWSDDKKIRIKRIFNRVIFDELSQTKLPSGTISFDKEYDVKWIPHPFWYYRISKFSLPFLHGECVPETYFLNEVKNPVPLDEYVIKPLFSYAGSGVIIDIKEEDVLQIKNPENFIIQKKVKYASIIQTPDEPATCEIRLFYFWDERWERPKAVFNLARLSKGKMIGTQYNIDKSWVGSSIAYFESIKAH